MISLAVLGNCQVATIQMLIEHMVHDVAVEAIDVSERSTRSLEHIQYVFRKFNQADYVLCQPSVLPHDVVAMLEQNLGHKYIRIADMYFRGLHPDLCLIGSYDQRKRSPSFYHSIVILDAYKKGLSPQQALHAFNYENFQHLGLTNAWETSLEELRQRDQQLDIPATQLVDCFCREFPGFLNLNHPSVALMHEYMVRIFEHVGAKYQPLNAAILHDPLAEHDVIPVLDLVAEYSHLPYRTSQQWLLMHPGRRYKNLYDVITAFYEGYRQMNVDQLIVNSPYDLRKQLQSNDRLRYLVEPNVSAHREAFWAKISEHIAHYSLTSKRTGV